MSLNTSDSNYKKTIFSKLLQNGSKSIDHFDKITDDQWVAIHEAYTSYTGTHADALRAYENACKSFVENDNSKTLAITNSILKYEQEVQIMFPELWEHIKKLIDSKIIVRNVSKKQEGKKYSNTTAILLLNTILLFIIFFKG